MHLADADPSAKPIPDLLVSNGLYGSSHPEGGDVRVADKPPGTKSGDAIDAGESAARQ
jgi:hypothetical protein